MKHVDLALESDSREEAFWLNGRILLQLGKRDAAAQVLQELKQILTAEDGLNYMWFWYHLQGKLAQIDQNYDMAIESFQKALSLAPLERDLYLTSLGDAFLQAGQPTRAIDYYKKSLSFNPNNGVTTFQLALAYEGLPDKTKALDSYRRVLEIWSNADLEIEKVKIAKQKLAAFSSKPAS